MIKKSVVLLLILAVIFTIVLASSFWQTKDLYTILGMRTEMISGISYYQDYKNIFEVSGDAADPAMKWIGQLNPKRIYQFSDSSEKPRHSLFIMTLKAVDGSTKTISVVTPRRVIYDTQYFDVDEHAMHELMKYLDISWAESVKVSNVFGPLDSGTGDFDFPEEKISALLDVLVSMEMSEIFTYESSNEIPNGSMELTIRGKAGDEVKWRYFSPQRMSRGNVLYEVKESSMNRLLEFLQEFVVPCGT